MTPEEIKAGWDKAYALFKEGKYAEALAVEMLSSDRTVIENYIKAAEKKA